MDKYHVLEFIGEGSFAKVYKGRKKYSGRVSQAILAIWFWAVETIIIVFKKDGGFEIYFKS